jgi:hypothetical protein
MEVSAETRAAFGWLSAGQTGFDPQTSKFEGEWQTLRLTIGPAEYAERSLDEIRDSFSKLIEPLLALGVVDLSELSRPRQKIQLDDEIAILDDVEKHPKRKAADVVLDEVLKATGSIGSQWKSLTRLLPLQSILERWIKNRGIASLEFDSSATNQRITLANQSTSPVMDTYKRGTLLVPPGSKITEEYLDILHAQYDQIERQVRLPERIVRLITVLLLLIVLSGLIGCYLVRNERRLAISNSKYRWGWFPPSPNIHCCFDRLHSETCLLITSACSAIVTATVVPLTRARPSIGRGCPRRRAL